MATIYDLKPRFQALLRPLNRRLARAGITPNQITLAALGLSVAEGLALAAAPGAAWPLLLLPGVLLVRMGLNAIDGMLAREHDMQTPLGTFLNELGDVVSDAALYLPLALHPALPAGLVFGIVLLGVLAEMAGTVAVQVGAGRRYDGPLGKSDRAFAFGLLGLLLGLGIAPGLWPSVLLGLTALLATLTPLNRVRHALEARQ